MEKILARKYLVKKISFKVYKAEKINLTPLYARKKILSPEVWGKKFLPKPNHPYPPPQKSNGRCLKGALTITHLRIFHVFQLFRIRSFFHRVSLFPTVGNSSRNYPQNIVWQQLCIIIRKLSVGLYSLGHRFYMFTWGLLGICGPVRVA